MIRLLADEHIPPQIVLALRREASEGTVTEVRELGLLGSTDSELLDWAADNRHVILTYDKKTLVPEALDRVAAGLEMPGVIVIRREVPVRDVVNDLIVILDCGHPDDLEGRTFFVPLT